MITLVLEPLFMLGDSDFNLYRIWLSSLNREVVLRQVFMEQYSENFPPLPCQKDRHKLFSTKWKFKYTMNKLLYKITI